MRTAASTSPSRLAAVLRRTSMPSRSSWRPPCAASSPTSSSCPRVRPSSSSTSAAKSLTQPHVRPLVGASRAPAGRPRRQHHGPARAPVRHGRRLRGHHARDDARCGGARARAARLPPGGVRCVAWLGHRAPSGLTSCFFSPVPIRTQRLLASVHADLHSPHVRCPLPHCCPSARRSTPPADRSSAVPFAIAASRRWPT